MIFDCNDAQGLSHLEDSTSRHYCRYKLSTAVILYKCAYINFNRNGGEIAISPLSVLPSLVHYHSLHVSEVVWRSQSASLCFFSLSGLATP